MESEHKPVGKPIVIAIDESVTYRDLLRQVFTYFLPDYELRLFRDGQALLTAPIDGNRPGLVVLGASAQPGAGYELMRLLRQQACWQHVPMVMMGNEEGPDAVAACYGAGANSFLIKPLSLEPIRKVFETVCHYWFKVHQHTPV
ncbi:response regulator [Fibrella forsythiae]|uniref:Response regulator n=1 Tax=Fibrella forsythiae TaxID=2817061 RepID=A0ABS3JI97_9BACT|nr:response regulator [Fibrella forsythiae]MBO0949734.1 response regulator [Fibrella forsythiae]